MNLATALMMLIGFGMFIASAFYRAPDAPAIPSFNPKDWKPLWKQKDHFRGPGYKLAILGLNIAGLGIILRLIFLGWDSWGF